MSRGNTFWLRYAVLTPMMVSALAVGGCSSTYDYIMGPSDKTPATMPNAADLKASAQKPYPSLATVPPPPTNAPTVAERTAMVDGLIADRSHAVYADNQVRDDSSNIAALVEQSSMPQNVPMQQLGRPGSAGPRRVASASVRPIEGRPRAMSVAPVRRLPLLGPPIAGQTRSVAPLPTPAPVVAPATDSSGLTVGGALGGAAPPPAAAATDDSGLAVGGALGGGAPQPRATPQPEATQAPPPPPNLAPTPAITKPAPAPQTAPKAAATQAAPPAAPVPEQVGALPVMPPNLGATSTPPVSPAAPARSESRLGAIAFRPGVTEVAAGNPAVAAAVAAFQKQGGKIHVVGFAPQASASASDTTGSVLSGYQAALANAAAVKKALIGAGVPAGQIVTEAGSKPAESGRADILLVH